MAERALELGREQVGEARATGRSLSERALRMHCAAYLASVKARLLTAVILDMKATKSTLAHGYSAKAEALSRAEERLKVETEARERLQAQIIQSERMRAASALASGVAHDLKNYLYVIGAGLEKASESAATPDLKEALADARDATRSATELAARLLDLERPKAPERRITDVNAVVGKCVQLLQPALAVNLELRSAPDPRRPMALLDADQWLQALLNLGINARDALGDRKGAVTYATGMARIQHLPPAAPEGAAPGEYAWVRVTDNGTGMSPEVMARVFEPFFTTKAHGKGTGLGLTLVYGCAQAHGGWIEVSSKEGQGTTFQLFVPAAKAEGGTVEGGTVEAGSAGDAGTILVVDDLDIGRRASGRMIERLGYRSVLAASAEEAVSMATNLGGQLKLVLTDLRMPLRDGRWLLTALREKGIHAPVVVCSGSFDRAEAPPEGFDGTLPKPFTLEVARQVLGEVLLRHAQRATPKAP